MCQIYGSALIRRHQRIHFTQADINGMDVSGLPQFDLIVDDGSHNLEDMVVSFNKLKGQLASRPGVTNPGALAAVIGRKKYGAPAFQKAAASGTSMRPTKHSKRRRQMKRAMTPAKGLPFGGKQAPPFGR